MWRVPTRSLLRVAIAWGHLHLLASCQRRVDISFVIRPPISRKKTSNDASLTLASRGNCGICTEGCQQPFRLVRQPVIWLAVHALIHFHRWLAVHAGNHFHRLVTDQPKGL